MLYLSLVKITVNSELSMKQLGKTIGELLVGGELLQLVGDVGAGKTTFTKGLAEGLDIAETVQSPTFTISRLYDDARDNLRLAHYDFYRLSDPGIMADELIETRNDSATIVCIEWGAIVRDVLGNDFLEVQFASPTETDRELTLVPHGTSAEKFIDTLSERL